MHGTMRLIGRIIVLTLALPFLILALPVLLIWACVRLCGKGIRRDDTEHDDETRLMQRIHSDMIRIDRRVESLETLLLEETYERREEFGHEWTDTIRTSDTVAGRH